MTDQAMLQWVQNMWFGGDGEGVEQRTSKIVLTRKPHFCPGLSRGGEHTIPPGTRACCEHALVDGKWRSAYTCEAHILEWAHTSDPQSIPQ